MIDDVAAAFERVRDRNLDGRPGRNDAAPVDTVFRYDTKKWWAQALEDAKIEKLRWHDLRHRFSSQPAQSGVGLKVIPQAAGHKIIAMAARYSHMDQTSLRSVLAALNRPVVDCWTNRILDSARWHPKTERGKLATRSLSRANVFILRPCSVR